MNAAEIIMTAMKTNAGFEFLDEVVVAALKDARNNILEERELLDSINNKLTHEEDDWNSVVQDIHAFNRVIKYFGG